MKIKDCKVNLRKRRINDEKEELYLDYFRNGRRYRKATGVFIYDGSTRRIRKTNEENWMIAEEKRKALEDTLNGRGDGELASSVSFWDYYERCAYMHEGKTKMSWDSALVHLRLYEPDEHLTLGDITKEWVEGFKDYLLNGSVTKTERRKDKRYGRNCKWCKDKTKGNTPQPLSQNTAANYFSKLIACLNKARADRMIRDNPADGIRRIAVTESTRSYLSAAELKRLMGTGCEDENVKRAFIFACMTGLRFTDVRSLTWDNIQEADGYTRLVFRQQKTRDQEYPPLNDLALQQIGKRWTSPRPFIFDIGDNHRCNDVLGRWCEAAGIAKHITFHCARHTFATLLLEADTDIYTASKLLGHRKVSTTQIYAKVVDKRQREAVQRLNDLI